MTLPTSSALPPPKAMTPSWPPAAKRRTALDVGADGIGPDLGEQGGRQPGRCVAGQRLAHHRLLGEARIGDEQRPRDAERAARLGKLGDAAAAEADRGGIVPVGVGQAHQAGLKWKERGRVTLSNPQRPSERRARSA